MAKSGRMTSNVVVSLNSSFAVLTYINAAYFVSRYELAWWCRMTEVFFTYKAAD